MNHKLISIIAAASLLAASAVSCGKTAGKASSDAVLDIKPTGASEASSEADEKTTTKPADDKKEKTTTTSAKDGEEPTTKPGEEVTEPEEDDPAEPATEAPEEPEQPEPATEAPAPAATSPRSPSAGDIGQNVSLYTGFLGDIDTQDAGPCLPGGSSGVIYPYNGLKITCFSTGEIYQFDITNSNFSTDAGITVGSSSADILAAYPGAVEVFGDYEYYSGSVKTTFLMSGDAVSSIEIKRN